MSPEIADIIKNASPWEIQQLRAMGMYIPENWHGRKMEAFDPKKSVGLRGQCASAGVAFFMKQLEVDGKITGDMEKFPEDLRVREWPKVKA